MKNSLPYILLSFLIFIVTSCTNGFEEQTTLFGVENQKLERISSKDIRIKQLVRYQVNGQFDISEDKIYIEVPITDNRLKIQFVENISSNDINALFIHLDGANGETTNTAPITGILKLNLSISKLNFELNELAEDKKIKVIVLHDDEYTNQFESYRFCIETLTIYNKNDCLNTNNRRLPEEQDGDIIIGG